MVQEDQLRSEFMSVFKNADYPVNGVMELAGALPKGPLTKFETDDFSMRASTLSKKLDGDFPYETPEAVVDDIMEQLKATGDI